MQSLLQNMYQLWHLPAQKMIYTQSEFSTCVCRENDFQLDHKLRDHGKQLFVVMAKWYDTHLSTDELQTTFQQF